ncbi:biotin transporter BioY [Nakamurella sp. YIM 132087]|uniref:Biotin transporter n=1 Tax=Nakamurella alba TaxID=2665158 RepID=A0A7K1FEP3_9ACTN|nr:biotin transporter BioY [Nakamurella alba]MTD12577.1 biotin transporter BioY [Nakamurella alba]
MADRRTTARDLAQIAVFAALIAALGLTGTLYLGGGTAVPITLQTLGVMLAGAILGPRKGFLAVLVFELLVMTGLPLLSGGRGGIGVLAGPTAGYLIGWLPGVFVVGFLTKRILPRYPLWLGIVVTAIGGVLVIYTIGTIWLIAKGIAPGVAISSNVNFLIGDAIKVVVTALVAKQVHRSYPGLIGGVPARSPLAGRPTASLEK